MRTNRMKAKLLAGEPAFGVTLLFHSPQLVEMIGKLGFDWVLIDCEHGALTPESVEVMCMAADLAGITPIARPATNSPEAILQVMDRGASGVQVPHINTAADAQAAVKAVKFHPLGTRGLAMGPRPTDYGLVASMEQYVKDVNRETLVCVQLEEAEAIRNADEILQVENVDVFFIGPSDLSHSMGYPGRPDTPAVKEAIDSTFAKIVAAGKVPGIPAGADTLQAALDKGVRYTYTHLNRLLVSATSEYFEAARAWTGA